jgi:hypothetical protein
MVFRIAFNRGGVMSIHQRLSPVVLLLTLAAAPARADRLDQLSHSALSDPSWRVRVQALVVLGKLGDPRALPTLEQALSDEHESVRGLAAQILGKMAQPDDTEAVAALEAASHDRSAFVRDRSEASLALLKPGTGRAVAPTGRASGLHVEVGGIGTKTRNTPPELTRRLREFILRELARTPGLTIEGKPLSGFLIDSAITALTRKTAGDYVEVSCEVSFVVGRLPSKVMVMMTSGGATVQTPRLGFRADHERALQVDALKGAVEGAHQNLLAYLQMQR